MSCIVLLENVNEKLVRINFQVQNIGGQFGQEIVQLYIKAEECRLSQPPKMLKGFEKVGLMPGETTNVGFILDQDDLSFYDSALDTWVAGSGIHEVMVGSSSRNILLRDRFEC